ncbi:hypothetical protein [Phytomonospora endophytica]|uniref:Uncharacterized protein n=1 Tax=Phytomonospora endophytica TaxID=714109 RepID=A0A841FNR7_9ACTN|nr:hypothetical protein [Phytomonospora endophytica]MBB6037735.1 hypothetical protein [Phytomonospora endophytica]GIG67738.1 hypothetical protein Pen01_40330 [Phytomonospora endophytica]
MTTRVESNSYLTEEQHRVYTLRDSLTRNGGTPSGFLEVLAAVVEEGTWRKVPSGVNDDRPFESFKDFIEAKPPFGLNASVSDVRILLQLRHPHETNSEIRSRMDAMRATVRTLLGPVPGADPTLQDAREFGAFALTGGWHFGLMVARSVRPGATGKGRHDAKLSAKQFAKEAGTSTSRVMRFFRAWERAATAGVVPAAGMLSPGQELSLPEPQRWSEYFSAASTADDGVGGESLEVGDDVQRGRTDVMRRVIAEDPDAANAALEAIVERLEDDPELQTALVHEVSETPQLKKAIAAEGKRTSQLEYLHRIADEGKVKTPAGLLIEAPKAIRDAAARHLAKIQLSPTLDPGQAATEAYGSVRQLVAEAVESSSALQSEEQRAKARRVLGSAARNLAAIQSLLDSKEVDEDLLTELTSLQETVNGLVEQAAHIQG